MITPSELTQSGLPIGTEVPVARLQNAIDVAELHIVKSGVGDSAFAAMLALPSTDPIFTGGIVTLPDGNQFYCSGLRRTLFHFAFAVLLMQNANATNFGTVQKKDDYSTPADPYQIAKMNYSIACGYIRDVCRALGCTFKSKDGIFNNTL